MCLYYYPRCGVYLYASTEPILNRALDCLRLSVGKPERVMLGCGDILKLTSSGRREQSSFDMSRLLAPWDGPFARSARAGKKKRGNYEENSYLDALKSVAACYGYAPEAIDRLLKAGFSTDEIEDFLYEGAMYQ